MSKTIYNSSLTSLFVGIKFVFTKFAQISYMLVRLKNGYLRIIEYMVWVIDIRAKVDSDVNIIFFP